MPWGKRSEERLDPVAARAVLDADHAGLEDVKDRITEYLAVRKLRQDRGIEADPKSGAILTLIGPPGTGKTSIGESIARATGREFVRMSLGGVRDEAEIRGHRRTYIGALPGRLVRALRDAGTMNPVILLDEVDKVGADWRGDPSAALLEVLDPAQNHCFRDHYLDVELDLSQVMFIATANVADTIPGPLLDRMEVIRFDGYTSEEKLAIAKGYLWPRQRDRNGLREGEVAISDELLRMIIAEYTREAGVRNLERELGKLLRKTATGIAASLPVAPAESAPAAEEGAEPADRSEIGQQADAESATAGEETPTTPVTIDLETIRDALGRQRFFQESAARTAIPGVATGLAVTGTGGDVLFVEATAMKSSGSGGNGLVLTGQLGDVMKESARIALSYVRGHAEELGIDESAFEGQEFHVHVPAGAIPKDGPSAGVTMVTALASLLTGRPVKHTVGMTGEVTLQGRVLPIGGLKQKVLAAHAAGLTDVILPERNRGDLDDIPQEVREQMTFHPVMTVQEVLDLALEPARDVATSSRRPPRAPSPRCPPPPASAPAGASRSPRRSAVRRTSWSAAGSCRSSTPPSLARCASTSSPRRCTASPRGCSPSACATWRPPASCSAPFSPRARRRSSTGSPRAGGAWRPWSKRCALTRRGRRRGPRGNPQAQLACLPTTSCKRFQKGNRVGGVGEVGHYVVAIVIAHSYLKPNQRPRGLRCNIPTEQLVCLSHRRDGCLRTV